MSEQNKAGIYVYQPHPISRKDGKLWAVGGIPYAMEREVAEAIVDAINEIAWMMDECPSCGHSLRFTASHCPKCGTKAPAPWDVSA